MSDNGQNEKPVFDWGNMTLDEMLAFSEKNAILFDKQRQAAENPDEHDDEKEKRRKQKIQTKALVDSQILIKQIRDDMAKHLVSLPRSFMIDKAPVEIAAGEHMQYLRMDKWNELRSIFTRGYSEESKN